MTNAKIA